MDATEVTFWAEVVRTAAYCMPQAAMNAIDTAKLWCGIVAGAAAVVSLIMLGIGIWMQTERHDGGQMLSKLSRWIFGAVLVTAAGAIVAIFVRYPVDCVPLG